MAQRKPLVLVGGVVQELPDGDAMAGGSAGAVSPGTILYVAGDTPPPGYLKADGSAVSRLEYAALFAVIGTQYGEGDGQTTFNLPDLRGEFLRGVDDGRGVDAGRVIGSTQGDAIRNITGEYRRGLVNENTIPDAGATSGAFTTGGSRITSGKAIGNSSGNYPGYSALRLDVSEQVPTANENRPRNVALLAVIKWTADGDFVSQASEFGRDLVLQTTAANARSYLQAAPLESPVFIGSPGVPNLRFENVAADDANTLDYYETGTFTPFLNGSSTAGSGTYNRQLGKYVRIGKQVFYWVSVRTTSWSGGAGQLGIGGFPFVASVAQEGRGGGAINHISGLATSIISATAVMQGGTNNLLLFCSRGLATGTLNMEVSWLGAGSNLYATGSYIVD